MAVEKFPDEISAIRAMLSEHPEGLSIRSISAILGINRNSVAKYLEMLQMQGGLTLKRSGPSKIYCLADKLPAAAVLKLAKSHVLIFNQMLTAADVNDSFTNLLKFSKKELIGKTLDDLPFVVKCHPALLTLIKEGVRGNESKTSASIKLGNHSVPCKLTISPVFFEDGKNGVSLIIDLEQEPKNGEMNGECQDISPAEMDVTEYICRFAQDGTLTYVNKAYCDLLHKTMSELTGHPWRPTIPESEFKKIKTCIASLNPAHPVASLDLRAISPDGDTQWQRWKIRRLSDRQGQSADYQATGRDITEIKTLEQNVSSRADELENLIRVRKAEIQDLNKQIYNEIASHEKTHFQLQFTQFAMDNASYMIMWIGRDGRFVYMNKEAQNVLGYHYRDVILKKFVDVFAGVFPFPWDEVCEIIKTDNQYTIETVLVTIEGKEIPVEMNLNYLEFKDKPYCCCFAKDITERKRVVAALKKSEYKYRTLVENIPEKIFIKDVSLAYISCNDFYASDLGIAADEIAGKTDFDFFSRDLAEKFRADDRMIMVSGTASRIEERYIIQGKESWVSTLKTPIRDDTGNVSGVLGIFHDITDSKRAEEALHLFKDLVEHSSDAIGMSTPDGRHYYQNKSFNCLFGDIGDYPPNTVYVDKAIGNQVFETILRGGSYQGEVEMFKNDRTILDIFLRAYAIKNPEGHILGLVGLHTDITDHKCAEEALHISNKKLTLLSSITRDDINNQMTELKGYLALLEEKKDDPRFPEFFQKITDTADRISSMIQFSRQYDSIGVKAPVWQDCCSLVETAAKDALLGKVQLKNDLPAGTEVFADPLVVKVFYSLMDNAVRYGSKITTIRFCAEECNGNLVVECEDDGVGIIAEEKEKIFERGFGKNTGLGLFLSREILAITGITLRETGETGKGARFEITVPKGSWRMVRTGG